MGTFGQQALGALKNAGLNAIGGLPQFAFSMGTSLLNNYLANKSAEKQFNRQIDFWEMQNEYNTPLAQRRRLEQAGFNPALALGDVAGNNTAGNLSTVPGNTYAQSGVFDINALQNSMNAFGVLEQIGADTDLMRSQIELNLIEKIIKNAEAFGIDLDNQQKQKLLNWLDKEKEVSLEKMMAEISNIKSDTDLKEANITLAEAETNLANAQTDYVELQKQYQQILVDNAPEQIRAGIQRDLAAAEASFASALASTAQAQYNEAMKNHVDQEEARRQALHTIELEIQGYLRDIQATERDIQKVEAYMNELWTGKKHDYTWNDFGSMILDFIKENISIMGVGSSSRNTAVVPTISRQPIGYK